MVNRKVFSALLTGLFFASGHADVLATNLLPRSTNSLVPHYAPFQVMAPDSIDLSKIPVSEKELAPFPVFNPPAGLTALNKPIVRDFDRLFFPTREGMVSLEGSVYKSFITNVEGKEWSLPYFEKSYRDLITAAGGVLIFQGRVAPQELERIKDEATYFGEEGSIDYPNTLVRVYAIRRKDGRHLFVQMSGYSAGASIQILQLPGKEK